MTFLGEAFNTCQPVRGDNISNLFRWLKESFRTISMLDFPYETDLFGKLPAYPVKVYGTLFKIECKSGYNYYPVLLNSRKISAT